MERLAEVVKMQFDIFDLVMAAERVMAEAEGTSLDHQQYLLRGEVKWGSTPSRQGKDTGAPSTTRDRGRDSDTDRDREGGTGTGTRLGTGTRTGAWAVTGADWGNI